MKKSTVRILGRVSAAAGAVVLVVTAAMSGGTAAGEEVVDERIVQVPGFWRTRVGQMEVTALYDGFVPIRADELRGAPPAQVERLLESDFLPAQGDPRTSVNAFLIGVGDELILVDTGAGNALGPNTGALLANLKASGFEADDIDHILITHLHPDHLRGLILDNGAAAFPDAQVHVSRADADYWLNEKNAAAATGRQKQIHQWDLEAVAPYRKAGRFHTFEAGAAPIPGVESVMAEGHTPGHAAYVFGTGSDRLILWGDLVHSYSVQLPLPQVSIGRDSDQADAVRTRVALLHRAADEKLVVGAAHLPFPGIGHLRAERSGYTWVPLEYAPLTH